MKKFNADKLAIKLVTKILSSDPEVIIGKSRNEGGQYAATAVADFIQTLSIRLQSDVDSHLLDVVLDNT